MEVTAKTKMLCVSLADFGSIQEVLIVSETAQDLRNPKPGNFMDLKILPGTEFDGFFKPGKKYSLTFTEVE